MKKHILLLGVGVLSCMFSSLALGRGRGGGGGGGGMSRGGMSRPSGGMSRPAVHAPSMSRPNVSRPSMPTSRPNVSRPSMPTQRPNVSRPNVSLPSTKPARPSIPNVSRPNLPTTRPGAGTRPNLPTTRPNLPTTRPNLPTTLPGSGASRPNLPGAGGSRPNLPGSGGSTRPNLPSGFPGNGAKPGFSRPGTRPSPGDVGDFLNLPGGNRPTTLPANRPNINRPEIGNRPSVGNRPNIGNQLGNGNKIANTDIRKNFQGGHNVNIGNVDVNIRKNNINNVRNQWNNVNNRPFGRNWWVDPGYSRPPASWRWQTGWGRYPGNWCWRPCTWVAVGGWFTWNAVQPVSYSYGTNVVYRDNYVYVNDQQVAPAEEYYTQATEIAESIPAEVQPENVEWLPLGVYAITDAEGTDTGMLLQLAVSKEGIIAGTFYNSTTEDGRPVDGMVDRESQRAAWHFSDKESPVVMEAGIYDLTKDETPALLHFDQDNSQNWLLVRLPAPEDEAK